ncbi:MAG: hypothetical protein AB7J28_12280 [Hyphomonadaceae bacterium]
MATQNFNLNPANQRAAHDTLAVSPDGSIIVAGPRFLPTNGLLVVDWASSSSYVLEHPEPDVLVTEAALSTDGSTLALVVTRPLFFGVSEIWLTDPSGNVRDIIGQPRRSLRYPAFSPGGDRLAFFQDIDGDRFRIAPNLREAMTYSVFEMALDTREVQARTSSAYAALCGIFYLDDSIYYCAAAPMERLNDGTYVFEHSPSTLRGEDVRFPNHRLVPTLRDNQADEPVDRSGLLVGVSRSGSLLLSRGVQARTDPSCTAVLVDADGAERQLAHPPGRVCHFAVSADGTTVAGLGYDSVAFTPTTSRLVVWRSGTIVFDALFSELQTGTPRQLQQREGASATR